MPETACLHIQARESDPIRVVELPGASVRIGRAPFCEVHLPELALADEECELRRRGATWHLVPVAAPGALSIEGRLVDRPRPLPYGVALRVGDFSLTLRPACASPPDWNAAAAAPRPAAASTATMHDRLRRATSAPRPRAATVEREKQWEARWKAAAERLKSASETAVVPAPKPAPAAPVPEVPRAAERLGGWRQAELPRRDAARSAARPVAASTFPSLKTVDAPSAYPRPRHPARTTLSATATIAPTPQAESREDDAAVFLPPSELDWAEAEARQGVLEDSVPAAVEPVPDIHVPVVEEPAPGEPLEQNDAPAEAPHATPSLIGRVGRGIRSLWGRRSAPSSIAEDHDSARDPSEFATALPAPTTGPSEAAACAGTDADRPLADAEAAGLEPLTIGLRTGAGNSQHLSPRERSAAGRVRVERSRRQGTDPHPAAARPPSPEGRGSRNAHAFPSGMQLLRALTSTLADPALAENGAQEPLSPRGRGETTTEGPTTTGSTDPEPPREAIAPPSEPAFEATAAVDESSTEATPPPRRPLFARRRAKPRTRTPHLGSVRVVPNDETRVPPPSAPTQSRAPSAGNRAAGHTEPPPERPRGAEPSPFITRSWQADTGPWNGLGASAVSTNTWDAGVGREGHTVRAPHAHAHGPAHEASANQSWPSARDILAARVAPRKTHPTAPTGAPKRPQPTVAREPEHFTVPLWLGWPPLAAWAVGAAVLGVALAWTWAQDARIAGVIASDLSHSKYDGKFPLAPEEAAPPAWWRTTAGALARRAAALGRSEDADPEDVRTLLAVATQASPLEPSARLALARLPARDDDRPVRLKSVGLSRDALALAWTGSQLLKAGQKEPAIRAYRRALEIAATAEVSRLADPAYNEDPQVRRYALPGEDLIGRIVRDIAGHTEWAFDDWSPALPSYAVAPLTAARLLREHDRASSDALVERLTSDDESRIPPPGTPAAIHFAARAEAFALKREWAQAQALYEHAIGLMPSDRVRRSWQINIADLALRQNDDAARQKALEAANNHDPNDPITLRAVDLQKAPGERVGRGTTARRDESVRRSAGDAAR